MEDAAILGQLSTAKAFLSLCLALLAKLPALLLGAPFGLHLDIRD